MPPAMKPVCRSIEHLFERSARSGFSARAGSGSGEQPVVAAAALVLVGLASMTATVIGAAARQALTPDEMLGRVSAGTRVVGLGSAGLGGLDGGLTAQLGSLTTPLLVASAAAAAAAIGFVLASRSSSRT